MATKKKNMELKNKTTPSVDYSTKHYMDNGWTNIKNFFTKKEVSLVRKKINYSLRLNYKKYKGRDINFIGDGKKFSHINTFHKLHDFKFIKKMAHEKRIKNTVRSLLRANKLELRASELFAKPKNCGLKVPIHQDNFYWNVVGGKALTIWIALSPSSKKNGGIFYYNNSHKKGVLPHAPSFAKGSSQTIKNKTFLKKFKIVYPKLNIGDALIHSCLIVHGSHKNNSDMSRKGFTFQFKTKKSKYDFSKIKKYEKKLQEQIDLRKK